MLPETKVLPSLSSKFKVFYEIYVKFWRNTFKLVTKRNKKRNKIFSADHTKTHWSTRCNLLFNSFRLYYIFQCSNLFWKYFRLEVFKVLSFNSKRSRISSSKSLISSIALSKLTIHRKVVHISINNGRYPFLPANNYKCDANITFTHKHIICHFKYPRIHY